MATSSLYLHEHLEQIHYNLKKQMDMKKKLAINKAIC